MFIPQILETKIYAKPLEVEQDCSAVSWTFLPPNYITSEVPEILMVIFNNFPQHRYLAIISSDLPEFQIIHNIHVYYT